MLLIWECRTRRKFIDKEIPFTAKYYSSQAQPVRMTEADKSRREEKTKENEYRMFHDLMKKTNNQNVDNIVAELKEESLHDSPPPQQDPTDESLDIELLADFVPIAVYDPNKHGKDYTCPVC